MGIKERREREKQNIKSTIMKIVNRIVSEKGWNGVTMRKIAEEIEYSPPIIYEHFDSKDAILHELKCEAFGKLLKQNQKIIKEVNDPIACLQQLSVQYFDFCMNNKGYTKVMMGLDGIPSELNKGIDEWKENQQLFKQCIAKAIGQGDFNVSQINDGLMLYRCFMRGIISAALPRDLANDTERFHYLVHKGVDNLLKGLQSEPVSSGFQEQVHITPHTPEL